MKIKITENQLQLIKDTYTEKQRKYMCVQANLPANKRKKGLKKKDAWEMCKDTELSGKQS